MSNRKRSKKPGAPRKKRNDRPRGTHSKGSQKKADNPPSKERTDGLHRIKLTAMAHGGYALGKNKKRMTFVPYTIPGESILVRIIEKKGSVDFAEGVELVEASADRVFPQCAHFGPGACWGCQWQHISEHAQLLLKQDVVADQLFRLGDFEDAIVERALKPVIPSPQQWNYNYHATFERAKDGSLGFFRIDGRSIEAIESCAVLHPDLQALYEMLDIDYADMKQLALWRGSDGETMLIITMSSEDAPQLTADMPTSVNVILPDNEPVNLVGDSMLHYEVGGRLFRVTAGGFFRANLSQIENLIAEVLDMLRLKEHDSVLDLYAGVGLFSAFMAPRSGLVTLVESYPPMATDAEENLSEFEHVDIIEGSVEEVLQSLIEAGEIYEAALLDPPAHGLSKQALEGLTTMNIPRLVYISSDPASFSRDARELVKQGYQLTRVQPIDFAPQTYYIDLVALFTR